MSYEVRISDWFFFVFKQKTAYEMRISDLSSDVCSSDLDGAAGLQQAVALGRLDHREADSILDRSTGVAAFRLDPHLRVGEQPRDADMRGMADGLEDRIGFHRRCTPS